VKERGIEDEHEKLTMASILPFIPTKKCLQYVLCKKPTTKLLVSCQASMGMEWVEGFISKNG